MFHLQFDSFISSIRSHLSQVFMIQLTSTFAIIYCFSSFLVHFTATFHSNFFQPSFQIFFHENVTKKKSTFRQLLKVQFAYKNECELSFVLQKDERVLSVGVLEGRKECWKERNMEKFWAKKENYGRKVKERKLGTKEE